MSDTFFLGFGDCCDAADHPSDWICSIFGARPVCGGVIIIEPDHSASALQKKLQERIKKLLETNQQPSPELLEQLATAMQANGQYQEAALLANKTLERLDNSHINSRNRLYMIQAQSLQALGKHDKANQLFERITNDMS